MLGERATPALVLPSADSAPLTPKVARKVKPVMDGGRSGSLKLVSVRLGSRAF